MPSPFPGMNPYLEHPTLWSGIHHRLITAIANDLAPKLRPKYIAAIEERVYELSGETSVLVGVPDVSIQRSTAVFPEQEANLAIADRNAIEVTLPQTETLIEGYLEIRLVETGEVITAIEVLSLKNKQSNVGRIQYEAKRQKILQSQTHFVEIDLLCQGQPMPILERDLDSDYRILVSRSQTRPKAELYPFKLPERIPPFPLPLQESDPEAIVDLQPLLHQVYEEGSYDLRLNYDRPPIPNVSRSIANWLEDLLRQQGFATTDE